MHLYAAADDDDCVGILTTVPDHLANYLYQQNDVYWNDFVFAGDDLITLWNLTRLANTGSVLGETASVTLDMEQYQMSLHLAIANDPDRVWQKIGPG